MEKIKKLKTSLLTPAELVTIARDYLQAIEALAAEHPFIALIVGLLTADIDRLTKAIIAVRQNKLIDDVFEADLLRDDLYKTFRDQLLLNRRMRPGPKLDAYQLLWPIMERAGTKLYALGYKEQSGKMISLFAELDLPENVAAMQTLGAYDYYLEMKAAQADFTSIYSDRLDETMKIQYPTLREARLKIVPHINTLLMNIDILIETSPEGTHDELVASMDGYTAQIMTTARARKSRSKNGKTEEEPDEPVDELPEGIGG